MTHEPKETLTDAVSESASVQLHRAVSAPQERVFLICKNVQSDNDKRETKVSLVFIIYQSLT